MAQKVDHKFLGKIDGFVRMIKAMVSKYMKIYNNPSWVDLFQSLRDKYNNTENIDTHLVPDEVTTEKKTK